jgi:IMP dehydrogenase
VIYASLRIKLVLDFVFASALYMDMKTITEALTFDDVLLGPQHSTVTPDLADPSTKIAKSIDLKIPVLASAMDTVSEYEMGIAMARSGGMAVIHRNISPQAQGAMVANVKAEKSDANIAAAIGTGADSIERVNELVKSNVDLIIVDTAHGHSENVLRMIEKIRNIHRDIRICGGNIATDKAAQALIDVGVDCVKVGIGPGSICTTRIVAGVGVPQLTAVINVSEVARKHNVSVIADGGIRHSGDIVKAMAAGANAVMIGSLLAGTDESPGDIVEMNGSKFKAYRGMGSIGAMQQGSADRYFQKGSEGADKLIAEGVEGLVPAKGPVGDILHQLVGGLRSGMGYLGAQTLVDLYERGEFVKISNAGLAESHIHDLSAAHSAPNYKKGT